MTENVGAENVGAENVAAERTVTDNRGAAERTLTERDVKLTRAARRLRSRSGRGELDRILLVGGAVVLPLGLALILLGWFGASHTTLVFEQNAYLLSGGMLGLALVFAGGFSYFAWWLTKLIREGREHHERLVRELRAQAEASRDQMAAMTAVLRRIETALSADGSGADGSGADGSSADGSSGKTPPVVRRTRSSREGA